MKKTFIIIGIALCAILILVAAFVGSVYLQFTLWFDKDFVKAYDANFKPIENFRLEAGTMNTKPGLSYDNQCALQILVDQKPIEFKRKYGGGTDIRCEVIEQNRWKLKIAYTGKGTVKETGEVEDINLLCEYKIYSYFLKPTVTYSKYK